LDRESESFYKLLDNLHAFLVTGRASLRRKKKIIRMDDGKFREDKRQDKVTD
jgi:hypothetical protein